MSKIENLMSLNKKLVEINYSNSELIAISKNERISRYISSGQQCKEKFVTMTTKLWN